MCNVTPYMFCCLKLPQRLHHTLCQIPHSGRGNVHVKQMNRTEGYHLLGLRRADWYMGTDISKVLAASIRVELL